MRRLMKWLVPLWLVLNIPFATANERIITLAPHLTEWVYSLGLQDQLVAVSEYSDYPEAAKQLPRVASHLGADIAAIAALQPDWILAWDGGNKPQDIARLEALGFDVFRSSITQPSDIADEIEALGEEFEVELTAELIAGQMRSKLNKLQQQYAHLPKLNVFYYSWTQPLMSIGPNAWANKVLAYCGAQTILQTSPSDYPEVTLATVITQQPDMLIAASKQSLEQLGAYWAPHQAVLQAPLINVDPDRLHRFTVRLVPEMTRLCEMINSHRNQQ